MNYKVEKKIICEETGEEFCVGDIVSIRYSNGGGNGCCEITKITGTGFHFNNGGKRDKNVQLKDITKLQQQNDEGVKDDAH